MATSERETIGFLVWRLSMRWRAAVDRAVAELGLTHAQYSLLGSLRGLTRSGAAPTQRQLADHTGLDPIHVSKLCRALHDAALISRTTDPTDGRAVRLALTEQGVRVADQAIALVAALLEELTAPLGGTGSARTGRLRRELIALLDVDATHGGTP